MQRTASRQLINLQKAIAMIAFALVISLGFGLVDAKPAQAVTTDCHWPRCTLHLSKKETRNYAYYGVLPSFPSGTGFTQAAYYVAMMAHRWFAIQYADRGKCISFVLSAVPWETQGLYGRRC